MNQELFFESKTSKADDQPSRKPVPISPDMLIPSKAGQLIDFEQGMSRFPLVTCAMIAVLGVVYLWEFSSGALASSQDLINAGALYRDGVFNGEIWRLCTAIFLHGSFDHLVGNCIALYILGVACEHIYGSKQTIGAYWMSGICGSILSTLTDPGPGVGASGAIFGLLGMFITFLWTNDQLFVPRNKRVCAALAIWAGYSMLGGFLNPMIDNMAHVGGFVAGAIGSFFWKPVILNNVSSI